MNKAAIKIKVCGMREPENIKAVSSAPINFMGFIFYPKSSRYVGNIDEHLLKLTNKEITKIAVFVNEDFNELKRIVKKYDFQVIQLHGNESPAYCAQAKALGIKVIKAFPIDSAFNFAQLEEYLPMVDFFLFDTKCENYGGSGNKFNWELLDKYQLNKAFFLSGGINEKDSLEIIQLKHPQFYGVDINSGFEIAPALKDASKVQSFSQQLKQGLES